MKIRVSLEVVLHYPEEILEGDDETVNSRVHELLDPLYSGIEDSYGGFTITKSGITEVVKDEPLMQIASFDDISDIHQEDEQFAHCIRVFLMEPFESQCPNPAQLADLLKVVGLDQFPVDSDQFCLDWRDDSEVWIRFNNN